MLALAALFGLAIGASVGALGGGGSVLAVPILVYVLDQDVADATTTSLAVVAAASLAGMAGHARAGRVCWRHAGSFTAAAVPGLVAGTAAAEAVGGSLLLGAFAFVMLAAAAATWRKADGKDADGEWTPGGSACPPLRMPRDIVAGMAVGALTGFFGVGGGFLIVPTLAIALAFTLRTAVGTSLAIIAGTSLIGVGVHVAAGRGLEVGVTGVMAATCAAGALAGAAVAGRLPERALGRAFALMVVAVAAYLLVSVTLLGGPPGAG